MHVLDLIKNSLLEDCVEAIQHGETGPTDAAISTCISIMRRVSPSDLDRLKWVAFGEGTGGVSLVARSLATNRRADFCISPDGLSVGIICLDETTTSVSTEKSAPVDDANCVDGITQWLNDSWRIGCGGIGCERPGSITGRPSR